jgi:hypothetical protein
MNPSLKRQEGRETLMEAKKVFEKEQPKMAEIEGEGSESSQEPLIDDSDVEFVELPQK